MRYSDDSFTTSFITTIGIDFKVKTIDVDGKRVKLQIWDTAGQERFRTITTDVRNWMRQIQQHASPNVNKILVANKCDVDPSDRAVSKEQGEALAAEYGVQFFETSAKSNLQVDEAFRSIAVDVQKRLAESDSDRLDVASQSRVKLDEQATRSASSDGCC
ncbi:hypothetical protein DYB32_008195 [Aphanomyces invadans]|uniref:Uncharacterized protein n=1 Tax=Aphanomyces invadans TaxID=157072 RepID=A0A3R7CVV2_9STRA|nr:hypothetical protein DYB32_008195 [Aphanomyces invadans]